MAKHIIIADDEYFIRQRIKKIIPWQELDLELSGEAENGQEVLDLLAETAVDIILLDIKMPKMSGLEAIRHISEQYPSVSLLILSGYDDFTYACTALKYGVKDYLLKPVSEEQLTESLQKCIHSIKRAGLNSIEPVRRQNMQACYSEYTLYVGIYLSEDSETVLKQFMDTLCQADHRLECIKEDKHTCILQMFFKSSEDASHIGSFFTDFLNAQRQYLFLYIGNLFPVAADWVPYYQRCLKRLTSRYFTSSSNLLMEYQTTDPPMPFTDLLKMRQEILLSLNHVDPLSFYQQIETLFRNIYESRSDDYLRLVITELLTIYLNYYQVPEGLDVSLNEYIRTVIDEEFSLNHLKERILTYGYQCMEKNEAVPSDIVLCKKLTAYIKEHYASPDLSITQIASVFQLNPSYMGSIFKKIHQVTLLQYLTTIRLEAAKELLNKHGMKVSEIAGAVGYSDIFYFSRRFKKMFGYSPTDYQHKHENPLVKKPI